MDSSVLYFSRLSHKIIDVFGFGKNEKGNYPNTNMQINYFF